MKIKIAGYIFAGDHWILLPLWPLYLFLDTEEEIYDRLSYNIHMPEDENHFIDIPPEFRLDLLIS